MITDPLFPRSKVPKMAGDPVFPRSKVFGLACFPIFWSSQVLKRGRFPILPKSQVSISTQNSITNNRAALGHLNKNMTIKTYSRPRSSIFP